MPTFETNQQKEALAISLRVSHLEAANAAEFKQDVAQLSLPHSGKVIVECSKLEFIDSSGLGALLHLNNSLQPDVRPLVLSQLHPEVLSVIELLRLNTVFTIEG
ncbi:MAG: STAS domain-containing protein [Puniceicoccales bacterium]